MTRAATMISKAGFNMSHVLESRPRSLEIGVRPRSAFGSPEYSPDASYRAAIKAARILGWEVDNRAGYGSWFVRPAADIVSTTCSYR